MRSTMSRAGRDRQNDDDDDDVDSSSSSSSESESEGEDEGSAEVGEQPLQCVNQLTLVDDDDCNLLIQQAMQPEGGESCDMPAAILVFFGLGRCLGSPQWSSFVLRHCLVSPDMSHTLVRFLFTTSILLSSVSVNFFFHDHCLQLCLMQSSSSNIKYI